jgi:hypothetical protein
VVVIGLCCIALGMHIGTWHMKQDHGLRDFNPGIFARADRWQIGAYHNSERRTSAYVSYAFPLTQRLALNVGLVTGYSRATIAPAVVLSYGFDNGLRLVGIPHTPKSSGGLHAAYEFQRNAP